MTAITSIHARRVWDSRGKPTVEAEVTLESGACGRAITPAGASTGSGEARELRDGGTPLRGLDVQQAVRNVDGPIAAALRGMDGLDQGAVDAAMIRLDGTPDKSKLGGNAIVAVSLACLHAAAAQAKVPLWKHLAAGRRVAMPVPEIQIYGGGAHARARVDLQDFMVVCPGAGNFAEALEMTAEVYYAAGARLAKKGALQGVADEGGYWPSFRSNEEGLSELVRSIEDAGFRPGKDVAIALDIAATQLHQAGRYALALENRTLSAEQFALMLERWVDAYPIVSIEDPFAETDTEAMIAFTKRVGHRIQIVGDDYFVTDAARIKAAAAVGACNTVLIKPNQIGTVTEAYAAVKAAREAGFGAIVSARSGETEDVSIVHLAIGWGVPQLKVGSFSRSERMVKWNEGIRIEEALGSSAQPFAAGRLFKRTGA
jgi:enolase